jgi:DNA-binding transcriptional LysR family regulator
LVVVDALREGPLVPVLTESHVAEVAPLSAVHPHSRHRMQKVRAFLDFLFERFGDSPWREPQVVKQRLEDRIGSNSPVARH